MVWKRHNPGCPCCCPCACYKFDGDGKAACQGLDLTATDDDGESYDTGKFEGEEKKAAKFAGATVFEHDDNTCFNLGESDPRIADKEGINVWFWLKADHTAPYSWGVGAVEPEGVITKGDWNKSSPTSLDFDGEWGIFFDTGSVGHATYVGNIWFLVGNGSGDPYDANQINRAATEGDWEFYFFWVSISEEKMYVIQDDASTEEEDLTGTQTKVSDKKLYIGNNTEGKKLGEQAPGGARPWLLDNVGFCKDIGTKEEMEERAANLYNDGEGRECNHAGLTDSGCC